VNNVSAKLLLSLFPPQRPFFRLDIAADTAKEMGSSLGPAQEALADISTKAQSLVESSGSRPLWMEVFRHLVVAGNVLVYHPDDGNRDAPLAGRPICGPPRRPGQLARRRHRGGGLPLRARRGDPCGRHHLPEEDADGTPVGQGEDKVKLYTMILRDGDNLIHYQEINDIEVPGSRGQAKLDVAGWQALRWQAVPGSDYGRSMVAEYAGDFLSLEEGWKAVIMFAAEAARIIRIADPNSGVDIEEFATAETGDVITGFVDKIQTLQLEKGADFSTLWNVLESIERRLSQAFLLTANTIRDAERVTAEEIRAVAQELEDSFGGTYTVLSAEAQAPYARAFSTS
jgi:hypothetical protein